MTLQSRFHAKMSCLKIIADVSKILKSIQCEITFICNLLLKTFNGFV